MPFSTMTPGIGWVGANIMPWREIGLLDIAKNLPQRRRRRGNYEASTHSVVQIGIRLAPFNPDR